MEHIWQSLVDGIRKFCKENGFSDVALGLSGGLDSAVVAVAAAEALGGEHVHAFMMKTVNTSDLSLFIAKQIAKLNYLDFKEIDIQHIIDDQTAFLQSLFVAKPKNIVLEKKLSDGQRPSDHFIYIQEYLQPEFSKIFFAFGYFSKSSSKEGSKNTSPRMVFRSGAWVSGLTKSVV